jgi:hypothetical protein
MMMIIANYLFIGAVLMLLVDSMAHWMQKTNTNSNNDYTFTNTERIIVIAFWPIVILFAVINIIVNKANQN